MLCYRSADGKQHQVSSRIPAQTRFHGKAVRMAEEAPRHPLSSRGSGFGQTI